MISQLQWVRTEDGSNSLLNNEIGEQYHSKHGAQQESKHVFVQAGLAFAMQQFSATQIHILEVGFGTGLNYLNSKMYAEQNSIDLNYTGIEAFPLDLEWIEGSGYADLVTDNIWMDFMSVYTNAVVKHECSANFDLAKCTLMQFQSEKKFHLLYYDAFSVAHQPEMWDETAIAHACSFLVDNGVFVTYAITGKLKRMLKDLGFEIQKLPGALGKREMLRAIKIPS